MALQKWAASANEVFFRRVQSHMSLLKVDGQLPTNRDYPIVNRHKTKELNLDPVLIYFSLFLSGFCSSIYVRYIILKTQSDVFYGSFTSIGRRGTDLPK